MMIADGALLEEVWGTDFSVKKKKKDKKTSSNTEGFLPEMEKDLEREKQKHIFPSQQENIDGFDTLFGKTTNIMPFGESNFFSLTGQEDVGRYSPISTQKPSGGYSNNNNNSNSNSNNNNNNSNNNSSNNNNNNNSNSNNNNNNSNNNNSNNNNSNNNNSNNTNSNNNNSVQPPTVRSDKPTRNIEVKQQLPEQPYPWDNGVNISKEEYDAFQEFKAFRSQQKNEMMNKQRDLSQTNNEGFANVNDDFNDVLLFGLLGIFFLIFTDYIYKLGRKSY